jgi:hypothetical protein
MLLDSGRHGVCRWDAEKQTPSSAADVVCGLEAQRGRYFRVRLHWGFNTVLSRRGRTFFLDNDVHAAFDGRLLHTIEGRRGTGCCRRVRVAVFHGVVRLAAALGTS